MHQQAGPCIPKLTSQVLETRCSLEKRPSLLDVSLVFACQKGVHVWVNQVREEMKPGEVSDLLSKVLGRREPKHQDLPPALSQSIPASLPLHLSLVLSTTNRLDAVAMLHGLGRGFWAREATCTPVWEGGAAARSCPATAPPGHPIHNIIHITPVSVC